jgi:hypothetical protein
MGGRGCALKGGPLFSRHGNFFVLIAPFSTPLRFRDASLPGVTAKVQEIPGRDSVLPNECSEKRRVIAALRPDDH